MGEAKRRREFQARTTIPDHIKADIARIVTGVTVAGPHRADAPETSGRPKRIVRDERKGAERQLI
jgi:hypothetical protein